MNILLLGEAPGTRRILNQMLGKSRHRLIQQAWADMPEPDLEQYDMVLVDGNVCDCSQQARLLEWVREAQAAFSRLASSGIKLCGHSCSG